MKLAAFNATCPFEIGDKIGMRKKACAVGSRTPARWAAERLTLSLNGLSPTLCVCTQSKPER